MHTKLHIKACFMKKKFLLSMLLAISFFVGKAQTDQMIETAEMYISDKNFDKASEIYKELLKKDSENPEYNFRYGYCLLNTINGTYESIQYLEKSVELFKKSNNTEGLFLDAYYILGKAYHENYMFEESVNLFTDLKKYSENLFFLKTIEREIYISKNAYELFMNPQELVVAKLGAINSVYSDHSPIISADESTLIFTSKRENSTGGLITPEGGFYEDVYIYDKTKGLDARPVNIGKPINTEKHEATCGLSADGQEMFLYRSESEKEGNIYYSKLIGDKWSVPEKLDDNINSKYRETSATISIDGKKLYFSSNRKGGLGGYDIYVSERKSDGSWTKAKNVGKPINTEYDEEGPYIHADGKTLYFSSKGHPGMGGYDIFYSEIDKNGNWKTPKNMGFPLNTVNNDVYYVPTADGKRGYYSSQTGGVSDIYIAQFFNQKEKELSLVRGYTMDRERVCIDTFAIKDCNFHGDTIVTPKSRILFSNRMYFNKDSILITTRKKTNESIIVTDSTFKVPSNTTIYVIDADTKILENSYSPNALTGKYMFVLNKKRNYKIYYEAPGYFFDTKDIELKNLNIYKEIDYNADIDSIIPGKIERSKKIGFEQGLTKINNFTVLELEILSLFLKKHDNLYVNFTGYDYLFDDSNRNFFPLEYEYAVERKNRVIKYLENKGINPQRIYTDMFPAAIFGDSIQYTIFDEKALKLTAAVKDERRQTFIKAYTEANMTEEQILELYGIDTLYTGKSVVVSNMLFDINKSVSDRYAENLDILAQYLKENTDSEIEIGGYTDEQGNSKYNQNLAKKRADFIKNQLIKRGVSKKQLKIKNYAWKNPIARNKTNDGEFIWDALPYNRRVEIKVLKESNNNTNIFVKDIEVPEEYRISKTEIQTGKTFSISLMVTEQKQDVEDFTDYKTVHEKRYSDGTYMYYFGEFNNKEEVLNELMIIKTKFPEAFIFVKSF